MENILPFPTIRQFKNADEPEYFREPTLEELQAIIEHVIRMKQHIDRIKSNLSQREAMITETMSLVEFFLDNRRDK